MNVLYAERALIKSCPHTHHGCVVAAFLLTFEIHHALLPHLLLVNPMLSVLPSFIRMSLLSLLSMRAWRRTLTLHSPLHPYASITHNFNHPSNGILRRNTNTHPMSTICHTAINTMIVLI